jgi:hypothetical protein
MDPVFDMQKDGYFAENENQPFHSAHQSSLALSIRGP